MVHEHDRSPLPLGKSGSPIARERWTPKFSSLDRGTLRVYFYFCRAPRFSIRVSEIPGLAMLVNDCVDL